MHQNIKFLNEAARRRVVTLAWPFSLNGKEFNEIHLARLSTAEVAQFVEDLSKKAEDARFVWPIFRDVDGAVIPAEVMDALDDDDRAELDKAALDFLPRRFRGDPEQDLGLQDGGSTAPSSAASSAGASAS